MEEHRHIVEVLGVPEEHLSADRMVDKLLIHFLRPRHGGGEVLRVLYPSYEPGQAFIVYEEPRVAARVLQWRPHMLDLGDKKFPLTVKAPDPGFAVAGEFPAEATVNLQDFHDKSAVLQLLRSLGLRSGPSAGGTGDLVRVRGSFSKLGVAKARLEELHKAQTQSVNSGVAASGGGSQYRSGGRSGSDGGRSPEGSQQRRRSSGREAFVVDEDVLLYAEKFHKRNMDAVLQSHDVTLEVQKRSGGVCGILLEGRGAREAAGKLQSFLDALSQSLRTQEVHLASTDNRARADLNARIQKYKDDYQSVLIRKFDDGVRLVGSAAESHELKQRLLGKPEESQRGSNKRSSSLPRAAQKGGAGQRERRGSFSEQKAGGDGQKKDKPSPRSPTKALMPVLDIMAKVKNMRNK